MYVLQHADKPELLRPAQGPEDQPAGEPVEGRRRSRWRWLALGLAALVGFFHYVKVGPNEVEEDREGGADEPRTRPSEQARSDRALRVLGPRSTTGWSRITFVLLALSGPGAVPSRHVLPDQPVRRRPVDAHPASVHRRGDVRRRSSGWPCASGATTSSTATTRQWLKQWRDVINNREDKLPEVGRYNAGQKLLFWVHGGLHGRAAVTGFVIWRPYFTPAFNITVVRIAVLCTRSPHSC